MISIIIASVKPDLLAKVEASISKTIGVNYEVIAIENGDGRMGLCELYNKGVSQSHFDVLCFMHEDIVFKTENWGALVLQIFENNKQLGLLGVAGSQYKSVAPSTWHSFKNEEPELLNYNFIQHFKFSEHKAILEYSNPENALLTNVATIDGLWFCCTRDAVQKYSFDEKILKGFHGYDLDFSIGIGQYFDVAVTFEILIEHFSEGNLNKNWLIDILKVHAKWSSLLPINIRNLSKKKIFFLEKNGFKASIQRMKAEGFTFSEINNVIFQGKKSRVMSFKLLLKIYFFLFKK